VIRHIEPMDWPQFGTPSQEVYETIISKLDEIVEVLNEVTSNT